MARCSKDSREAPPLFSLFDLPPKLQLQVLGNVDPDTFRYLITIDRRIRGLFMTYPEMVLQNVALSDGLQICNLLFSCLQLLQAIRWEVPPELGEDLNEYLSSTLDT